ncbi:amidase [Herbiconiux sp. CPCC 205716]|uniref:Amidase n=1 Tax=Herbiconiux gentiana TaxID=2970912 RepID=A0ABT2GAF4_9MICO|nr:amidase [Herbiconiux gentiana]MCS5713182.1 amidase [Herbiconiux gentiana]
MTTPLTLSAAAAALRDGSTTSVELVEHAIAEADLYDADLGTFLARYSETALEAAEVADELLAAGADVGPLHGIPLGIKDILTTVEGPTTAQSVVHDPEWNGRADASAVARLRAAGGIVMGKTTTWEFAVGLPDLTKPFPLPRNPWNTERYTGGSSSGSGNGVMAGMFLAAIGTDTGGSIRIPAAFCGITGLVPTFGRVSKAGCVPAVWSLDHIGPMARSAEDCAHLLQALAGFDPADVNSVSERVEPVPDYAAALTGDLAGVRVGVDLLTAWTDQDPTVPIALAVAVEHLRALGATVVDVSLPLYEETLAALYVTTGGELLGYHAPDAERAWGDYFAATRDMIARSIYYTAADYVQAQRVRRVSQQKLARVFEDVDLVITPTNNVGATGLDELHDLPSFVAAVNTSYWDVVGNPVMTVPNGFTAAGLPLGMQIAGRPFEEALVLRAGDAFQRVTDWHLRTAPLSSVVSA